MGTHITRVKSVNLDTWTTEQVEVRGAPAGRSALRQGAHRAETAVAGGAGAQNMLRWGNERANWYWEANMPPGTWQKTYGADARVAGAHRWLSQRAAPATSLSARGACRSRASLIRSKYEMRAWAAKTPIEATPPTRSPTAAAILGLSAEPASGGGEVRRGRRLVAAASAHAHRWLQHWVGRVRPGA